MYPRLGARTQNRISIESKRPKFIATVQRGLEPGSRGIAIVRSRYQATTSEDTAGWKRLSVWKSAMTL
jgi:hypothetical protein